MKKIQNTAKKGDEEGKKRKYKFYPIKKAEKIEKIIAHHDNIKEWKQDRKGYFLIKIDKNRKTIKVGFCKNSHILVKEIEGKNAEEICYTLVREKLVGSLQHASYLGRELMKAETALKLGLDYVQDSPLDFKK